MNININKSKILTICAFLMVSVTFNVYAKKDENKDIAIYKKLNLLNKIGYGFNSKEAQELINGNYYAWVENQLKNENPIKEKIENENTFSPKIEKDKDDFYRKYRDNDFNLVVVKKSGSTSDFVYGDYGLINSELDKRINYASNSQNRLGEMMVWFWFNHLTVGPRSNNISAIFLDDYENQIRKNALGKFKDLIKMSSTHPAMLYYLNNDLNRVVKYHVSGDTFKKGVEINENYAREFLELHTLGVNNGYTQKDVQELAKILTGHGLIFLSEYDKEINLNAIKKYSDLKSVISSIEDSKGDIYKISNFYLYRNEYHDKTDKIFLGKKIKSNSYKEMNDVINIVTKKKESADFLSKKMAVYLMNDEPSKDLIDSMSKKYLDSNTDIAETLRVLFYSKEFINSLDKPSKIKDPYVFTLSTLKTVFTDNPLEKQNVRKEVANFLSVIESDPYYKITPEGFSVYGKDWLSSARLQETIHFGIVNTLKYSSNLGYKINYKLLSQLANKNISNIDEAISYITSDNWLKR